MSACYQDIAMMVPQPERFRETKALSDEREVSLDASRGVAVCGMIILHLVPIDGFALVALEGVAAALFFILAGMAWTLHDRKRRSELQNNSYLIRRSLALIGIGVLMHMTFWSTEVLIPLGLCLIPTVMLGRSGRRFLYVGMAALVVVTLAFAVSFQGLVTVDWLENGSHVADVSFGWATLRYLLVDGNYPLIPWLVFPLFGATLVHRSKRLNTIDLFLALGLAFSFGALSKWSFAHEDRLGDLWPYLSTTWVPTTLPFVLFKGACAMTILIAMSLWNKLRWPGFAWLGRASFTHYLGHILLVFLPLKLVFPGEDWSTLVGWTCVAGYLVIAVPMSKLWLQVHRRGPLEALLARLSGGAR
jgi:uncharacterized membrane protein YeiB